MNRKVFEAKSGLLKSLAMDSKSLTAELLAQIMAGPPITAHADIDSRILTLLITATDQNRSLRVRGCARRTVESAGWDLLDYTGPGATHVVQHNGHSYTMSLTTKRKAKEEVNG